MTREARPVSFVLASTAHGMMIVPRHDMVEVEGGAYGVGGQLLTIGAYEQAEVEQIKSLLSLRRQHYGDGVVMVDCGANIGCFTVDCACHMDGWGKVIAFEPQERLFYALAGNIVLNNLQNAQAIKMAVGRRTGFVDVPVINYDCPGSYGSLELLGENNDLGQDITGETPRLPVVMTTIDVHRFDRLDLLKIDVEGMELDVLEGAADTIARLRPILWVEHVKVGAEKLAPVIDRIGYTAIPAGMNLLCVPKDASYVRGKTRIYDDRNDKLDEVVRIGEAGDTHRAIDMLCGYDMTHNVDHPLHWRAMLNLGTLWMQVHETENAIKCYEDVIDNGTADLQDIAKFSRGFAHLQVGNLWLGFEDFEHRKMMDLPEVITSKPMLSRERGKGYTVGGESVVLFELRGKTILVVGEMGFGDNIMFARYLRGMAEGFGVNVIVAVPPEMTSLFRCLPYVQVHNEHSPPFDCWIRMMSLAHLFRTTIDTIPPPAVFDLPGDQLARWKAPMLNFSNDRLRVGLCWSGSRNSQYDKHRSVPLRELVPLFEVPGVEFFSLQLDVREDDRKVYDETAVMFGVGDKVANFLDTACAIKALDLVITVDTSVAHLAGSLGVPTLVMLTKFRTYWAWIQGRTDSPWYPSMLAVIQEKDGDWSGVVDKVIGYLGDFKRAREELRQ